MLDPEDRILLRSIAQQSGLGTFWLGGSATYARVAKGLGVSFALKDYDLAIPATEELAAVVTLREHGFEVELERPYYLKFRPARQVIARNADYCLDIAFVSQLDDLGHFNWEAIFWRFPTMELVDPYGAMNALQRRVLRPIIPVEAENPFLLCSRMAKLCARFDVPFDRDPVLRPFATALAKRIGDWATTDEFHGQYARGHGYAGLLQAILRAKDRLRFLERLGDSGLLQAMMPEAWYGRSAWRTLDPMLLGARTIADVLGFLERAAGDDRDALRALSTRSQLIGTRLHAGG